VTIETTPHETNQSMRLSTGSEAGTLPRKATTTLGIDYAMQSEVMTAASLLIVAEDHTAPNHMVIACSHATEAATLQYMQAPNGQVMQS
jgi:hypothetical protein